MVKAEEKVTLTCSSAENKLDSPERMTRRFYPNRMYMLMISSPKAHEAHSYGLRKPVTQEQDSIANDLN